MRKLILGLALLFATAVSAMAQTVPLGPRFVLPYQTVVDGTGAPIPGAQLWFYSSGTTTPLTTYSDPLLTTPNPNPVQANAAGVFPNIFLSGNYKIVLTDSSNNQIWTADPVYGVGTGSGGQCQSITVNNQTGTFYTLQPSDNCKLVTFSNSSAIAVNLPSPATNASYQKWNTTVSAIGTGVVTITTTGASFTGTGSGTNLTVSAVTGTIATGFLVTGTGVPANTTIVSQSSGTPGGAGVYVTSNATTSSGASLTAAAAISGNATLALVPGQAAQIISDGANYQVVLSSPAGSSVVVGTTVVLGGISGDFLTVAAGPLLGQVGPTGTGQVVLQTAPTIVSPHVTGSFVATGLVTNADLVNSQVTINGTACTLGGTCSPTAAATSIAVGTTTIAGGSGLGHVLSDNSGVVGELSTTVTVNGTACTLGSTCAPSSAATSITIGTTTIVSGSANALLAQSPSGATVAAISTANNDILATNGSGVAAFANTLPTAVQGNITSTGTLTGGATGAGFTIALTTSTVTGINVVANGGTGHNTLTSGAIYMGAGTSSTAASALSDNGTIVSSTEPLDLAGKSTISEIANAASTGTTVNKLAKLTGAPSTALITATTDTNGAVGVVVGGAGTTGNAQVAVSGQATCAFDGGTTAGDYVQISASVAGDCTDAGATYPSAHQVVGRVLATIGSAGNASIVVFPPEIDANTGGGGSGVTSVALIAGTGMQVSGACTSTTSISCTFNTQWSISGSNIYNNNAGTVGIGTSTSGSQELRVYGSNQVAYVGSSALGLNFVVNGTTDTQLIASDPGISVTKNFKIASGGYLYMLGAATSNCAGGNCIGINTATPSMLFDVGGTWGADASGHPYCDMRALGGGQGSATLDNTAWTSAASICAGGQIFFPCGTYHNNSGVPWTATGGTLVIGASEACVNIETTSTTVDIFNCSGGPNQTTFARLTITGSASGVPTAGYAINCSGGANNEHFEDMEITGTFNGIYPGGTNCTLNGNRIESIMGSFLVNETNGGCQIRDNQLDNNSVFNQTAGFGSSGICLYNTSGAAPGSGCPGAGSAYSVGYVVVSNGQFFIATACSGTCLTAPQGGGLTPTAMYTNITDGNITWQDIGSSTLTIVQAGTETWVTDNDLTSPARYAVSCDGNVGNGSKLWARGNDIGGIIGGGVVLAHGCTRSKITENVFTGIGLNGDNTVSGGYPIWDQNTTDANTIVSGNTFDNIGDGSIISQSSGWVISANNVNANSFSGTFYPIDMSAGTGMTATGNDVGGGTHSPGSMIARSGTSRVTVVGNTFYGNAANTGGATSVVNANNN